MQRGEVRLIDLEPARGSAANRRPPPIIVSNERASAIGPRVDSKAQAEQVRSVTFERIGPVLGRVPAQVMTEVDEALRLHLQL